MDMREAQLFSATTLPSSSVNHGDPSLLVVISLTISVMAWLFVSYWSLSVVGYGIESAKLYPPGFGQNEITMFALALQSVVSIFGLVVPLFLRRWGLVLVLPIVLSVYLMIVGFEGYHGVLAQHKTSVASAVLVQERAEISALSRRVTTASVQIGQAYQQKLDAYNALADDAANGRDESGIAMCDTICKKYRRNYAMARSRFAHLAMSATPAPILDHDTVDPRALLVDVIQRSEKLGSVGVDLATFYQALDQSNPPTVLTKEIEAIRRTAKEKARRFEQFHSLNTFTLALELTNKAFADLRNGHLPAVGSRLPLVYGLLPPLVLLALSFIIRACIAALKPRHYGLCQSLLDWLSHGLQSKILPKVDALSARNFLSRIRIRTRSWMGDRPPLPSRPYTDGGHVEAKEN